jgi:8-oxo-dGTP pyrophosphatase MutT (NUDIX family)
MKRLLSIQGAPGCSGSDDSSKWLHWEPFRKETLVDCKIFSVSKVEATSKCDSKRTGKFFTLNCGAWVNVIAITDDRQVIMVEQYRHGIQGLTLEIPGGSVDLTDSDPGAAAMRELREETGFIAERWSFLGKNHPNPALQDNICYSFLAEGARNVEAPKFDGSGTEKINTRYVQMSEIGSLIRDGNISHALVITAFHFLYLQRPELCQHAQPSELLQVAEQDTPT